MPDAAATSPRRVRGNDPRFTGLREQFVATFGDDDGDDNPHNDAFIRIVRAPGRVNLIGEHTDYADGLVFPMAIRPRLTFAYRRRNDGRLSVASDLDPDATYTFKFSDGPGEPDWTNYVRGVAALLARDGHSLLGMDVFIQSSLPPGAGLSSSAALEVGMCRAMLDLNGIDMTDAEVARLCQRAEHEFAGMPCGIMDQTAVAAGRAGHALLLDCRSHEVTHVPLPPDDVAVVVCDSKSPHTLTDSIYPELRKSVEAAAAKLGVSHLRDVTPADVENKRDALTGEMHPRARHVVTENARCLAFADALQAGDYATAGEAMYASHASLKTDYRVTTPELDALVDAVRGRDGVYGSRMTGAGFGGCTVTLCHPDAAADVMAALADAARGFGKETMPFVTAACDGAHVAD